MSSRTMDKGNSLKQWRLWRIVREEDSKPVMRGNVGKPNAEAVVQACHYAALVGEEGRMDASFWKDRWERGEIGFHEKQANPFLVAYFKELALAKGSRVFVPLSGKTLDIAWLLSQGYRVAGAELSEIAVRQLFEELGVEPKISGAGSVQRYRAQNIEIFLGDIFEVTREMLGPVDAIYDRAALVALPKDMRDRYTEHLVEISDNAPQLVIAYEYDQRVIGGPPFSVSQDEVRRHYTDSYNLTLLASSDVPGGLKGKYPATEHVWLLKNE